MNLKEEVDLDSDQDTKNSLIEEIDWEENDQVARGPVLRDRRLRNRQRPSYAILLLPVHRKVNRGTG